MTTPHTPTSGNPGMDTPDDELIEQLAAIEHERWADWQKWCHKILRENNPSPEQGDILERWDRQIETPYAELSEKEKQSDRDQVMRYLPIMQAWRDRQVKAALLDIKKSVYYRDIEKHGGANNKGFNKAVRWFHDNIDTALQSNTRRES
jgi:hypothetical protein